MGAQGRALCPVLPPKLEQSQDSVRPGSPITLSVWL